MRTHDCDPTFNDSQVLRFCQHGFMMLKGVVPKEINERTFEFLENHPSREPAEILEQEWFVNHVILNHQVTGAVRSLLGKDFRLTMPMMANHRVLCPQTALGGWHRDGSSMYDPQLDSLQVFYYPQDTAIEMGPTEVVPGSHNFFALPHYMRHYGSIKGSVSTTAPAGSIFITIYSIWHRRTASTAAGIRNLLKYWYIRTTPPTRDWIKEPGFNIAQVHHAKEECPYAREGHRARDDAAGIFHWLCGRHDECLAGKNNLPVYYIDGFS